MSSIVEVIAKQAQLTFSKNVTDDGFNDVLSELIKRVSELRATDLKLRRDASQTAKRAHAAKPSGDVTYIKVFENQIFSMGIFLLKSKARIPLHDHPGMHGVLKVIQGTVKITSYSALSDVPPSNRIPQDITNKVKSSQTDTLIPVKKHMSEDVTEKDEPCILRPKEGNYHEIRAKGGPAAFFDILAPPYDMKERDCQFYTALESKTPDTEVKIYLKRKEADFTYNSTRTPYRGPKVSLSL